jgi:hypothetical protein
MAAAAAAVVREVYYIPLRKETAADLSELCISVTCNDLLLVLAKNNSKYKE